MSIHDLEMTSITGEMISFSDYRDQVLLIVNLASQWGLTPQYAGLCTLQSEHDNLKILGFPCNQFGAQEPGTDEEILEFATSKYNANFQLFSKVEVNGDDACEIYNLLKAAKANPDGNPDIGWNFTKFLIDKEGNPVKRFAPITKPEKMEASIKKLL